METTINVNHELFYKFSNDTFENKPEKLNYNVFDDYNIRKYIDELLLNSSYISQNVVKNEYSSQSEWNILTSNSLFIDRKSNPMSWVIKYPIKQGLLFLSTNILWPKDGISRLYMDDFDKEILQKNNYLVNLWKNLEFNMFNISDFYDKEILNNIYNKWKYIYNIISEYINKDKENTNDWNILVLYWLLSFSINDDLKFNKSKIEKFQLILYNFNKDPNIPDKIKKLFIDKDPDNVICHRWNGYIGQVIRSAAFRDKTLTKTIILSRDAHATCPSSMDKSTIIKFIASKKKYLIGHNDLYEGWWHHVANNKYKKGIFMGYVSIKNDSILSMNDDLWIASWGKIFTIINYDNDDCYVKAIKERSENIQFQKDNKIFPKFIKFNDPWQYGLDEYIFTKMLYNNDGLTVDEYTVTNDDTKYYSESFYFKNRKFLLDNTHWHQLWFLFMTLQSNAYNTIPFITYAIKIIFTSYYDLVKDYYYNDFFLFCSNLHLQKNKSLEDIKKYYDNSIVYFALKIIPKMRNNFYLNGFNQMNDSFIKNKISNMFNDIKSFDDAKIFLKRQNCLVNSLNNKVPRIERNDRLLEINYEKDIPLCIARLGYPWSFHRNNNTDKFEFLPSKKHKLQIMSLMNDYDKSIIVDHVKDNYLDILCDKSDRNSYTYKLIVIKHYISYHKQDSDSFFEAGDNLNNEIEDNFDLPEIQKNINDHIDKINNIYIMNDKEINNLTKIMMSKEKDIFLLSFGESITPEVIHGIIELDIEDVSLMDLENAITACSYDIDYLIENHIDLDGIEDPKFNQQGKSMEHICKKIIGKYKNVKLSYEL